MIKSQKEPQGGQGMLTSSYQLQNGVLVQNRVVLQPMEGCDCNEDGSPSRLTEEKYLRDAEAGAGIVWCEANAVCPEGRTNPRQMMMTEKNLDAFKRMVEAIHIHAERAGGVQPLLFIQLTHSGRQSMTPMIAYRNAVYERTRPVTDSNVVSDEYLDALAERYALSARLAEEAGFDGVDVKSCHGYLMQETLSAFLRKGRYGGDFENRTRLLFDCFDAVKGAAHGKFVVTSRLGISDMVPYPYGFGTSEDNRLALDEPMRLIKILCEKGLYLLNVTLGNPYYNPHVNRPFRKGAYTPPECAEVSLSRFEETQKSIKAQFPSLAVVASGLSYYREGLMEKSEALIREGAADFVGYGRETLAYPAFYRDYLAGVFDAKKCCVACSKCTELMRNKQVSGCAVFNKYYRNLYRETVAKK